MKKTVLVSIVCAVVCTFVSLTAMAQEVTTVKQEARHIPTLIETIPAEAPKTAEVKTYTTVGGTAYKTYTATPTTPTEITLTKRDPNPPVVVKSKPTPPPIQEEEPKESRPAPVEKPVARRVHEKPYTPRYTDYTTSQTKKKCNCKDINGNYSTDDYYN